MEIQLLNEHAERPKFLTYGAAGADLYSVEDVEIPSGKVAAVGLGFARSIPEGYEAQIRPRSGLAFKNSVTVLNSPGTIDSDYRGEVKVILINHGEDTFQVKRGDRVAQIVFAQVHQPHFEEVDELEDTARGSGRFGSTGKD